MEQSLFIPGRLPGMNEIINENRSNKFAGAKTKKELTNDIGMLAKTNLHQCRSVFIEFHWIEPNKKRDPDNIAAGRKFILDGLVKGGILRNDGWKEVKGWEDKFFTDKLNPGVLIILREV